MIHLDTSEAEELEKIVDYLNDQIYEINAGGSLLPDKKTHFDQQFPELSQWAEELINEMGDEGDLAMHGRASEYGFEFVSSTDFQDSFVARVLQLCIRRYGIPPTSFFSAYNALDEDPDSNYGNLFKVFGDRIDYSCTLDMMREHELQLERQDLLACARSDDFEAFKTLYRAGQWGEKAQSALMLAARLEHHRIFEFLVEEGVPIDHPGLERLIVRRPALKAIIDARKLSQGIESASSSAKRPSIRRKGV